MALSVWGAVASGGAAVGVWLGGIITQYLNWRWNFFVNVPVGILVVVAALRTLGPPRVDAGTQQPRPARRCIGDRRAHDAGLWPGQGSGQRLDFAVRPLILFGIAIAALVLFIVNEQRAKHPLVPLRIFRIRNLAGADSLMFFMTAGMFSVFFFTTLYLQEILGYTPIKTGFSFLIVPLAIAIAATNVPRADPEDRL